MPVPRPPRAAVCRGRAQGRAGNRGAQPRQVAGRDGLHRPTAGQCQHVGFSSAAIERRCKPPTTSPASPPKTRCRAADADDIAPPLPTATSTCSTLGLDQREEATRIALECEAAAFAPPAHHQQRRRGRVGAAKPFFSAHAGLPGRLRHLAPVSPVHPSPRCPARTAKCSATPGTARSAARPSWQRLGDRPLCGPAGAERLGSR